MHRACGAVRAEQIDHPLVGIHDGNAQRVGGAFHLRVRVRAVFQQQPGDLVMAVIYGGIERVAARRDPLLGEIRIGVTVQQQLHDLDVSACSRIAQRRPGARVIGDVVRRSIGQRWVLIEQLSHAFEIPYVRRRADVAVRAAGTEVREHLSRRGRGVLGHVAPAAIHVVAIGELDRTRAVGAPRVDVRAARQQARRSCRAAASSPPSESADSSAHRRHARARARRRACFALLPGRAPGSPLRWLRLWAPLHSRRRARLPAASASRRIPGRERSGAACPGSPSLPDRRRASARTRRPRPDSPGRRRTEACGIGMRSARATDPCRAAASWFPGLPRSRRRTSPTLRCPVPGDQNSGSFFFSASGRIMRRIFSAADFTSGEELRSCGFSLITVSSPGRAHPGNVAGRCGGPRWSGNS